jgi:hypothetical protein
MINRNDITFGIVTFRQRRHLVKKLINNIRNFHGDNNDIILIINGNVDETMHDDYRTEMLELCKNVKNCYPFFCPEFKSLAKLWNNICIFSKTEYNFVVCDDVKYDQKDTLDIIINFINQTNSQFFTINNQFSFFVLTKTILHSIGYFDERLISFGEEDGDMVHRYIEKFGKRMDNIHIRDIMNGANYELRDEKIKTHIDNKPSINRKIAEIMYVKDPNGIKGMAPYPIKKTWPDIQQYPYEEFFNKNKTAIIKNGEIKI